MNIGTFESPVFDRSRPVVVLAGGHSAERDVSLRSGNAVHKALQKAGVMVRVIDPADQPISHIEFQPREVAFIALHGPYGEDGRCQCELAERGIPFTGTRDPRRLAQTMNKDHTRRAVKSAGVAIARGTTWVSGDTRPQTLQFPLVVKPNEQGSSVGLSLVRDASDLDHALHLATSSDPTGTALIEEYQPGDEWTVALLNAHAFPPVRIAHSEPLFDATAKYASAESRYEPLLNQDDIRFASLQATAHQAIAATGLTGLTRVDFIWNNGQPVFLEVNSIPGMTERSLAPMAAAAGGLSFADLCLAVLADAIADR